MALSPSRTHPLPPLPHPPPGLEFCPWRPGERDLLLVGEHEQEQPPEAQQQGQADGFGSAVRQARRGKSGVSVDAPQSVVLVHLKENKRVAFYLHVFFMLNSNKPRIFLVYSK